MTCVDSPVFTRKSDKIDDLVQGIVGGLYQRLSAERTRGNAPGALLAHHVATLTLRHGRRGEARADWTREQMNHVSIADLASWSRLWCRA